MQLVHVITLYSLNLRHKVLKRPIASTPTNNGSQTLPHFWWAKWRWWPMPFFCSKSNMHRSFPLSWNYSSDHTLNEMRTLFLSLIHAGQISEWYWVTHRSRNGSTRATCSALLRTEQVVHLCGTRLYCCLKERRPARWDLHDHKPVLVDQNKALQHNLKSAPVFFPRCVYWFLGSWPTPLFALALLRQGTRDLQEVTPTAQPGSFLTPKLQLLIYLISIAAVPSLLRMCLIVDICCGPGPLDWIHVSLVLHFWKKSH